ncbi:MAG: hypothetical protein ACKVYV_18365, partial [Limisphaerales bacterium]
MRNALRVAALLVFVIGAGFWFFGGPNLGWTRNSVPVTEKDPVTELEVTRWEKRFVPGVDFLAGVLAGSAALAGASFLFRRPA